MHLGLTEGPFVPHHLISTQESPVPLLKFQIMATIPTTSSLPTKTTSIAINNGYTTYQQNDKIYNHTNPKISNVSKTRNR